MTRPSTSLVRDSDRLPTIERAKSDFRREMDEDRGAFETHAAWLADMRR